MLYTIPDYYKEFSCTADACEDTCCAGWQIVIDKKSLKKYWNEKGPYKKKLRSSIKWLQGVFKQSSDKRCAFLNEDNLCDMYKNLGEKSLCRTCKLYPRHIEEFEGVREITLSVSCPEVAKILLYKDEPVTFLSCEKEGEETYEEFDFILYSKLVDAREIMREFLQNRELDMKIRAGLVLGMAHDMQVRINHENIFGIEDVFDRYQTRKAIEHVTKKLQIAEGQPMHIQHEKAQERFQKLYELELLREDWQVHLLETEDILYKQGAQNYRNIKRGFDSWVKEHLPRWEIMSEQLLVYFIYTYFCGAVYDTNVYAKARLAVDSLFFIYEMLAARWVKNEKDLNMEDIIEIVYRYSREVEHSDDNLKQMEE